MKKHVSITVLSSDYKTSSRYEMVVGPIGFLKIMWDFWKHNGTGFNDWARITASIETVNYWKKSTNDNPKEF